MLNALFSAALIRFPQMFFGAVNQVRLYYVILKNLSVNICPVIFLTVVFLNVACV